MKPIDEQVWKRGPGYVKCDAGVITIDDGSGRNVSTRSTTLDAIAALPELVNELRSVLFHTPPHRPARREHLAALLRKAGVALREE